MQPSHVDACVPLVAGGGACDGGSRVAPLRLDDADAALPDDVERDLRAYADERLELF